MKTLQLLRSAGRSVQMHAASADGLGSMKAQFKKADASGARYALVFGADEVARESVTVKPLREGDGLQTTYSLVNLFAWAQTLQSKA
jgi:histidyl-tRNA synthetase